MRISDLETPIMRDLNSIAGELCVFATIGTLFGLLFNRNEQKEEERKHQLDLIKFNEWAYGNDAERLKGYDLTNPKILAILLAEMWNERHADLYQADYRIGTSHMVRRQFEIYKAFN